MNGLHVFDFGVQHVYIGSYLVSIMFVYGLQVLDLRVQDVYIALFLVYISKLSVYIRIARV